MKIVDRIRKKQRNVRIVHFGQTIPSELLKAAGEGHQVLHASSAEELARTVEQAARPTRGQSTRYAVEDATVSFAGSVAKHAAIDASNQGISFCLALDEPLDPYLPGAILDGVAIVRGGIALLSDVSAVVRHVEVDGDSYKIGCELRAPAGREISASTLRDKAQCAGLIQSAIAGDGLLLQSNDDFGVDLEVTEADVEPDTQTITIQNASHSFEPFDVVAGTFEKHGKRYRFSTVVVSAAPLVLKLPARLEEMQQRCATRWHATSATPIVVELSGGLVSGKAKRSVRDISSAGFSFDIEATELFPIGMHVPNVVLTIGERTVRCSAQVKSLARIARAASTMRCGVAFEAIAESTKVEIAELISRLMFPTTESVPASFAELMQFFRDVGFMPPEKERVLAPLIDDVTRTFDTLAAKPNRLFKEVFIRDESDKIAGYVSGVRAFSGTIMFQHLAGARGKAAGRILLRSLTEHFIQHPECEYMKFFFLENNPFPVDICGTFGNKVIDPELCDMRLYAHVVMSSDVDLGAPATKLGVTEAMGEDLRFVERYFVANERGLLIKSDDLTREKLNLRTLNSTYQKLGLFRHRHVLIARRGTTPVGFALVEVSSPGINLSEGLSSFRMHVFDEGLAIEDDVRRALCTSIQSIHRNAGRSFILGLVPKEDAERFERLGAKCVATSYCVTAHRTQMRLFSEHIAVVNRSN